MGGKTFKNGTVRLRRVAAETFASKVLSILQNEFPDHAMHVIPAYVEKVDFGDIDVLMPELKLLDPVLLSSKLGATEWVSEGETTSFRVPTPDGPFQFDIMQVPAESYEFASKYYALNDVGNLIGAVARKAGFKLGHLGLFCPYHDIDGGISDIMVTLDWAEALTFLGYDPQKHESGIRGGFHSLQDVFEFTASGQYFSPALYADDEQNARSRARAKRRPTHQAFIKWLETHEDELHSFSWDAVEIRRRAFHEEALKRFPELHGRLAQASARDLLLLEEHQLQRTFAEKYSGNVVADLTGLAGPDLGRLMKKIEIAAGGRDELVKKVLDSSKEDIATLIRSHAPSSPGRRNE
jgi:hypothetical protein